MKPTPAFKWLLIFLIPLTFTWKLVATENQASDELQPKILQQNIGRFLENHNLHVTEDTPIDGVPVVRATSGDCSMIVAEVSPDGATRYVMGQLARAMDHSFIVYRGHIYGEQPTWTAITQDWWARALRKLGIARSQASSIMVAATRSCGAERLPWAELSASSLLLGRST